MMSHYEKAGSSFDSNKDATLARVNDYYEQDIRSWLTQQERDILDQIDSIDSLHSISHNERNQLTNWLSLKQREFEKFSRNIAQYVNQWNNVYQKVFQQLMKEHTETNNSNAQMRTMEEKIKQLSDIIRRKDREYNESKSDFEKHITLLESTLASSQPRSQASQQLKKLDELENHSKEQLARMEAELREHNFGNENNGSGNGNNNDNSNNNNNNNNKGNNQPRQYPSGVEEFLAKSIPTELRELQHELDHAKQIIRELHDSGVFELAITKIQKARITNPDLLAKKLGGFDAMLAFDANEREYIQNIVSINEDLRKIFKNGHIPPSIERNIMALGEDKIIGILIHKIRELEATMPYSPTAKLAILGALPRVITEQLRQLPSERLYQRVKIGYEEELFKKDMIRKGEDGMCKDLLDQINQIHDLVKNWDVYTIPGIQRFQIQHSSNASKFTAALQRALVSSVGKFVLYSIENEKLRTELFWLHGHLQAESEIDQKRNNYGENNNNNNNDEKATIDRNNENNLNSINNNNNNNNNNNGKAVTLDDESFRGFDRTITKIINETANMKQLLQESGLLSDRSHQSMFNDAQQMAISILETIDSNSQLLNDLNDQFNNIKNSINVSTQAKYVTKLEKRYQQIFGLFYMKASEVENLNDTVFTMEQKREEMAEIIQELERRVRNLMSSAAQNVKTRMESLHTNGYTQTFDEMMIQLNHKAQNCAKAADDLNNCVDQDLYPLLPQDYDAKTSQLIENYVRNIKHPCKFIKDEFETMLEEFVGVKQFVHQDRLMVEALQNEIKVLENEVKVLKNRLGISTTVSCA